MDRTPSKTGLLILLQIVCAFALALGVVIFLPTSLKTLSGDLLKFAVLLGVGYLLCAGLLSWRERSRTVGFETLISSLVIGFAPAILWGLHIHTAVPNKVLYAELLWGGVLATVTVVLQRRTSLRLAVLALFAAAGLALPILKHTEPVAISDVRPRARCASKSEAPCLLPRTRQVR